MSLIKCMAAPFLEPGSGESRQKNKAHLICRKDKGGRDAPNDRLMLSLTRSSTTCELTAEQN